MQIIWLSPPAPWRCDPRQAIASSFLRFLDHTQWRITVGRTSLDEWSACRTDLYLTTHNTRNRQISVPPVRFEPKISADESPQTYALDHTATGALIWRSYGRILLADSMYQQTCYEQEMLLVYLALQIPQTCRLVVTGLFHLILSKPINICHHKTDHQTVTKISSSGFRIWEPVKFITRFA